MDWDERTSWQSHAAHGGPKRQVTVGESLDSFGIAELEERVQALEAEIARTRAEIDKKRKHEAAASSLFKR